MCQLLFIEIFTIMVKLAATNKRGRPRQFDHKQALQKALEVFWIRGYEPASIAELCSAMGLTPPSLYAAFGNKEKLFLEVIQYYEATYWDATWQELEEEPDLYKAIKNFFKKAVKIMVAKNMPSGCMVVLAAINISPESQCVAEALKALRQEGRDCFLNRLQRAVEEGELPPKTDVKVLAVALNTFLDGMSIQSRDGLSQKELEHIAMSAVGMLPIISKK